MRVQGEPGPAYERLEVLSKKDCRTRWDHNIFDMKRGRGGGQLVLKVMFRRKYPRYESAVVWEKVMSDEVDDSQKGFPMSGG